MTKQKLNIKAIASAVAAVEQDYTVAVNNERTLPATGLARLRLVGYIELGEKYDDRFNKVKDRAWFVFELSGRNHQPRVMDDGTIIPHRIVVKTAKGANEKSNYFKLFQTLNWKKEATHPSELLGECYLGEVHHDAFESGGKMVPYAKLRDDNGYTIRKPQFEDPETGDVKTVTADEQISETMLFVWNAPTEYIGDLWASIFIAGRGDGDSDRDPNVYQNEIKDADNFQDSPIYNYLLSVGESTKAKRPPAPAPVAEDDAAIAAASKKAAALKRAAEAEAADEEAAAKADAAKKAAAEKAAAAAAAADDEDDDAELAAAVAAAKARKAAKAAAAAEATKEEAKAAPARAAADPELDGLMSDLDGLLAATDD